MSFQSEAKDKKIDFFKMKPGVRAAQLPSEMFPEPKLVFLQALVKSTNPVLKRKVTSLLQSTKNSHTCVYDTTVSLLQTA